MGNNTTIIRQKIMSADKRRIILTTYQPEVCKINDNGNKHR